MTTRGHDQTPSVLTVSELTQAIRRALRRALPGRVTVRGEIANVTRHPSGHMYFTLRDAGAALRCVMFRSVNRFLRFPVDNGVQVEARGEVGVYMPRGDVQLIVEEMHPAGPGAQMAAFEALKARLAEEGLLAPERKRALPRLPRGVGLVTSARGAAIRDLLEILRSRAPGIPVVLSPTIVQGEGAELAVAAALERLAGSGLADVIIVARGGGSIEDLWTFNTEPVARAIVSSSVPVVTGVGHETDVTLADLVADVRAATPTHAAQLAVPSTAELATGVLALEQRLVTRAAARLAVERERYQRVMRSHALRRPERLLIQARQSLDELSADLERALRSRVDLARSMLAGWPPRLEMGLRARRRATWRELEVLNVALGRGASRRLPALAAQLDGLAGRLRALGPRQVLGRGYVLARRADTGEAVSDVTTVAPGDRLRLDWAGGFVRATADSVHPEHHPQWDETEMTNGVEGVERRSRQTGRDG